MLRAQVRQETEISAQRVVNFTRKWSGGFDKKSFIMAYVKI